MSEKGPAPSRPPRVYVPDLTEQAARTDGTEERDILLGEEEREHVRSRRLREGDEIIAIDGKGLRARGTLTRRGSAVRLRLLPFEKPASSSFPSSSSFSSLPGEPAKQIVVALACGEPARVEWAVEKGTECGAAGFVLLACERSQRAHVAALSSPARLARLRRIAVEATKQCDRTRVPFVEGPESPAEFLKRGRGGVPLLVAHPSGPPLAPLTGEGAELAIGPEGGFSTSEDSLFEKAGALRASLGPRVLRLETAVVAALARLVDGG